MTPADALLFGLLVLGVLGGLLAVVLGLGGNFILLALALVTAWAGDFAHLTPGWLALCLGLVLLGEAIETMLGVLVARGFGASRWGMIGTFVGGLAGAALGTLWFPVVGSLLGAFVGGFAGAFLGELAAGRNPAESLRAGFGGFLGRVAATVIKLGIGLTLAFVTLRAGLSLFLEKS